jgi:cell wall-associated NlpC family hydrolase
MRALAAALLAPAVLAGCGMFQSRAEALRESVVETALDQVGEDYAYGGADPDDGFDCSGLVHYSYKEAGLKLPRSAAAQKKGGRPIKFSQAQPGDLLFYRFGDRKAGDLHVVMYLGDGEAVHAPVRDGEVEVIRVTARHWRDRYVGAARYIRED